jgi:hypothetical protein
MAPTKQVPISRSDLLSRNGVVFSFSLEAIVTKNYYQLSNSQKHSFLPIEPQHIMSKGDVRKRVGRKRKTSYIASSKNCSWCQTNQTGQWRRGPGGSQTLCNACGLEYSKQLKNNK